MGVVLSELVNVPLDDELSIDLVEKFYSDLDEISENELAEQEKATVSRLFLLAQHVMRFKEDQLSVALDELDQRAEVSGECEQLTAENSRLHALLASRTDNKQADASSLLEMHETIDSLKQELAVKQLGLDVEKKNCEKLTVRTEELEIERRDLRRQTEQLKQNLEDLRNSYTSKSDTEDYGSHNYADLLRQKNQNISVLLEDVENAEREASSLRQINSSLQQRLDDATVQMNAITAQLQQQQQQQQHQRSASSSDSGNGGGTGHEDDEDDEDEGQLVAELRRQLATQHQLLARRDRQFDQLSVHVQQRCEQLHELLAERDSQVHELKQQLTDSVHCDNQDGVADSVRVTQLTATCESQRRRITRLQRHLQRATADMNSTTALLKQQQQQQQQQQHTPSASGSSQLRDTVIPLRNQLTRAESQIVQLKDVQEHLHAQLTDRDKQLAEVTTRMRQLMSGEFGLTEAVADIRKCHQQMALRDTQLAEQNGYVNTLHAHMSSLVDENTALRARVGLGPHEAATLVTHDASREQLIRTLEKEVEKLEEERIALKLENRKISQQLTSGAVRGLSADEIRQVCQQRHEFWLAIKQHTATGGGEVPTAAAVSAHVTADQDHSVSSEATGQLPATSQLFERLARLQTQLTAAEQRACSCEQSSTQLLRENDQLRSGLKEVLDSIRQHNNNSAVAGGACVVAPSLEALLVALDTRRLTGHYHPALVNYTALKQLEARNDELRRQLHSLSRRTGDASVSVSGNSAGGNAEIPPGNITSLSDMPVLCDDSMSDKQLASALNQQLLQVLKSVDQRDATWRHLERQLRRARATCDVQRHQVTKLHQEQLVSRAKCDQLQEQLDSSLSEVEALRAQLRQSEACHNSASMTDQQQHQCTAVAQLHRQMALTVSQLVRCERRLAVSSATCRRHQLHMQWTQQQLHQQASSHARQLHNVCSENRSLQLQLVACHRQLAASVPLRQLQPMASELVRVAADSRAVSQARHELLDEHSATSRMQQELSVLLDGAVQCDSATNNNSQTSAAHSRLAHLINMNSLLKQQLHSAEQRGSQLQQQLDSLTSPCDVTKQQVHALIDSATAQLASLQAAKQPVLSGDVITEAGDSTGEHVHTGDKEDDVISAEYDMIGGEMAGGDQDQAEQRGSPCSSALSGYMERLQAEVEHSDDMRSCVATLQLQLLEAFQQQQEVEQRTVAGEKQLARALSQLQYEQQTSAKLRVTLAQNRAADSCRLQQLQTSLQQLRVQLAAGDGCHQLRRQLTERVCEVLEQRRQLCGVLRQRREAVEQLETERQCVRECGEIGSQQCDEQQNKCGDAATHWRDMYQKQALQNTQLCVQLQRQRRQCDSLRAQLCDEEARCTTAHVQLCRLQNQMTMASTITDEGVPPAPIISPQPADEAANNNPPPDDVASNLADNADKTNVAGTSVCVISPTGHVEAGSDITMTTSPAVLLKSLMKALIACVSCHGTSLVELLKNRDDQYQLTSSQTQRCCDLVGNLLETLASIDQHAFSAENNVLVNSAVQSLLTCYQDLLRASCNSSIATTVATTAATATNDTATVVAIDEVQSQMVPILRRVRVAEDAASCLRQRLQLKEEQLDRLMKQPFSEQLHEQLRQLTEQLIESRDKLRLQTCLTQSVQQELEVHKKQLHDLKQQHQRGARDDVSRDTDSMSSQPSYCSSSAQCGRCVEAGQLLSEQERAISALMQRLRQARDTETQLKQRVRRLECDMDHMAASSSTVDDSGADKPQQHGAVTNNNNNNTQPVSNDGDRQCLHLTAERDTTVSVDVSAITLDRVDKLFRQLLKQHPRQIRLIVSIKDQVRLLLRGGGEPDDDDVTNDVSAERVATEADQVSSASVKQLTQQLDKTRLALNQTHSELNERTLRCQRLQAEVYEMQRRRREQNCHHAQQMQQMRDRLQQLNDNCQLPRRSDRDRQKVDCEVARWEERKRVERVVAALRQQLSEHQHKSDSLTSSCNTLKQMLAREKRENRIQELKLRHIQKQQQQQLQEGVSKPGSGDVTGAATADWSGGGASQHNDSQDQHQVAALQQRVRSLAQKLARERTALRQVKKCSSECGQMQTELAELRSETERLQNDNKQLTVLTEQLRQQLDDAISDKQQQQHQQVDGGINTVGGGVAAQYTGGGTVVILRKLVERLRAENLRLRQKLLLSSVDTQSHCQLQIVRSDLKKAVEERDQLLLQRSPQQ